MSHPTSQFGTLLRQWRERRRVSQLDLASVAAVSARHLSFIETGRSRPSREMILHLAERLDVPLRERNHMLLAGGFAPVFGERSFDSGDMALVRAAVERLLTAHLPYPAIAVDRLWNVVLANRAAQGLMRDVPANLVEPPLNALRVTLHPQGLASSIENFGEWSAHILSRLDRAIANTGDEQLVQLRAELAEYPGVVEPVASARPNPAHGVLLTLRLRTSAGVASLFATQTVFGSPSDLMLDELSIEAFFPADAATTALLRSEG